jgi:hypothetical protein
VDLALPCVALSLTLTLSFTSHFSLLSSPKPLDPLMIPGPTSSQLITQMELWELGWERQLCTLPFLHLP